MLSLFIPPIFAHRCSARWDCTSADMYDAPAADMYLCRVRNCVLQQCATTASSVLQLCATAVCYNCLLQRCLTGVLPDRPPALRAMASSWHALQQTHLRLPVTTHRGKPLRNEALACL